MNRHRTLLGHLVPKLTVQVEDAATEALAFILNRSKDCRGALVGLLSGEDFGLEAISWVATQVTFEDKCRPDMAGYDRSGAMRLLVESKFWAGLGEGQACAYLRHLKEQEEGPAVLLFIAPDSRLASLWTEVISEIETGRGCIGGPCGPLEEIPGSEPVRKAKVRGSNKRVMLTGWSHLLDVLHQATADDEPAGTEIKQLQGLVDYMERDYTKAFAPLTAEELQSAIPARMLSLQRLVDETVNAAQADGWVTGARKSDASGGGYGKYFYLQGAHIWFGVYWRKWAHYGESPLWVWPSEEAHRRLLRRSIPSPDLDTFPVTLPLDADYQTVLQETLTQLEKIGHILKKHTALDSQP